MIYQTFLNFFQVRQHLLDLLAIQPDLGNLFELVRQARRHRAVQALERLSCELVQITFHRAQLHPFRDGGQAGGHRVDLAHALRHRREEILPKVRIVEMGR